ncbi:uncharacterized protein LOC128605732 [Ictalurus furcatus]|uniref:uncharacterized protein LOC128605732 n=1 Tax=Ictalurus furcatus TaxID=66913 RepID=UPI00234FF2BB|nr:uncharacterized protein LOC128605732 [Ictalurus furcatus]
MTRQKYLALVAETWLERENCGRRCREGAPKKEKKTSLLSDAAKCAEITDLFKHCAGGDEDSGKEAETSKWSEQEAETASLLWQSAHSAVKSLGDDAHFYLVSLFGQQTVSTLLKTTEDGIKEISQVVAHALNTVEVYITELLHAAGIDAKLQKLFTPEGVVLAGQWALLAMPRYWLLFAGVIALFPLKFIFVIGTVLKCGYWLLSLAVCLFAGVIRLALFPLKFIFTIVKIFKKFRKLARPLSEIRRKRKQK